MAKIVKSPEIGLHNALRELSGVFAQWRMNAMIWAQTHESNMSYGIRSPQDDLKDAVIAEDCRGFLAALASCEYISDYVLEELSSVGIEIDVSRTGY